MDNTLRSYLETADATHDFICKFGIALSSSALEEKIHELQTGIKNIQSIAKRMADVSNIVNQLLLRKKNANIDRDIVDPYPTERDHAVMRVKYPTTPKEIIDDIALPITNVNTIAEIPVSHIYYVKDLKQYAINIEGVVVKGNLSNIVEYQTAKTARCEYGTQCKSFAKITNKVDNKNNNKIHECKYYHDPEDYLQLGLPVPDNNVRNFTVGSWIYAKDKRTKTYFARHVGNRATLLADISMLKKIQYREEISNREGQLIHDLLIYMALHSKGFLEKYAHW